MTDENTKAKIDGWIPRHPREGWMGSCIETIVVERDYETALDELIEVNRYDAKERRNRIEEVKADGWEIVPVRIIPATDPTASEAAALERKRVIGEVRMYLEDDKRSYEESEKLVGEGSYANEIAVLANALSKLTELEGKV